VDGQIKRSFSSKEDAIIAGAVIKKAYPLVVVTVVDTEEHTTEIINAWLIVTDQFFSAGAIDRAPLYELIGDDIVPQMIVNLLGISRNNVCLN
jgi:hypothetical protein